MSAGPADLLRSVALRACAGARRLLRRPPPDLARFEPERILYCRPDHIGDAYLSIPALVSLRARYPSAHISLLVASWSAPLFDDHPYCDEVRVCDPPWWVRRRKAEVAAGAGTWRALWREVRALRRTRLDLCIEARGDPRQLLCFGWLTGARVILSRDRHGGGVLADALVPIDESAHEIDQNLALQAPLGGAAGQGRAGFPLPFGAAQHAEVAAALDRNGIAADAPLVLVHPGGKWVNRWPEASWAAWMAQLSSRQPVQFVLTGSAEEEPLCARLAATCPRAGNLAGQLSLQGSAALMARARLVVMGDTGPMHFLNPVPTPALLLFGATPPARFAPRGAHVRVLQGGPCCEPRLHEACRRARPPQASDCMRSLEVASVLRAAIDALREAENRAV